MANYWVVVANASRARVFSTTSANFTYPLSFERDFVHPESRLKDTDLVSDRIGHYQSSISGSTSGDYEPRTDPKQAEMTNFAKMLSEQLEASQNSYESLILVAPPHFCGLLEEQLSDSLRKKVVKKIVKDFTLVKEKELLDSLQSSVVEQ